MKYFPSRVFLREKLRRKAEDSELVEKVMTELESLIVEEKNIESRVHEYVSLGKTPRYIRTKLLQKKFDPQMIDVALEWESDILKNPETYRDQIIKIVQKSVQKWLSKKLLRYELQMKYPDAHSIVSELLSDYNDLSILQKKAPELLGKYTQEQVVAKLCQKGFNFSDIYTVLRRR
jgi:SOS response regulatory protein OraA/RecX